MTADAKFRKSERLCSKKIIKNLFATGKRLKHYPFKVVYDFRPYVDSSVKIVIGVPKKNHKPAVKRNLIKRRVRESYRRNKNTLIDILKDKNRTLNLVLIYVSLQVIEYAEIERKLVGLLADLAEKIKKDIDIHSDNID